MNRVKHIFCLFKTKQPKYFLSFEINSRLKLVKGKVKILCMCIIFFKINARWYH